MLDKLLSAGWYVMTNDTLLFAFFSLYWMRSSTHTGEQFIIYCNANCKTENIIYLLECAICGLQYIGETKQLSKRLNGHRSDANCKPDLPLIEQTVCPNTTGGDQHE
jgi:hypothetical protein